MDLCRTLPTLSGIKRWEKLGFLLLSREGEEAIQNIGILIGK